MSDLLQWWNLVYVLAFFLAFLYVLLSAIGLASGGGGADAHMDAHVDAHAEADTHVDAHAEVHGDFHGSAAHAAPGLLQEALSVLGVGRVPLSVVLITFLLIFSVVGWTLNMALSKVVWPPVLFFAISFVAATLCGMGGTRLLSGTLGRYMRPFESAGIPRAALVGSIGTACLSINEDFGNAFVRDPYGTTHKVVCRVPKGFAPVAKGQTVLLVRYVQEELPGRRTGGYYLVESYNLPAV